MTSEDKQKIDSKNKSSKLDKSNEEIIEENSNGDTVSYSSYLKLLNQRKADQSKARELEDKLNEILAEKQADQQKNLEEQGKYRELWEESQKQIQKINEERKNEKKALLNHKKLSSFKEIVGDLANPKYASLIDLDKITVDENGDIIKESLEIYGNWFKTNHPELLKNNTRLKIPTSEAPSDYKLPHEKKPTTSKELFDLFKKQGGKLTFK